MLLIFVSQYVCYFIIYFSFLFDLLKTNSRIAERGNGTYNYVA